jgi:hypothetical protein
MQASGILDEYDPNIHRLKARFAMRQTTEDAVDNLAVTADLTWSPSSNVH